jgi:hypothetical protein
MKDPFATLSALMHSVRAGAALSHFAHPLMCDRRFVRALIRLSSRDADLLCAEVNRALYSALHSLSLTSTSIRLVSGFRLLG